MFVDFGMAQQYDGVCYLRFDDTNPEAEKQVSGGWDTRLKGPQ
jgi:glutamyl/glutaminyl-tRNA synthetase